MERKSEEGKAAPEWRWKRREVYAGRDGIGLFLRFCPY
jgi:hypothetical protein